MLEGGDEIAGKPAVIDVPRGKGHIILMSTNPMWRMNTSGLYALVMNAVMEMARRCAMTWSPEQYERFKSERKQPFLDLLALVEKRPRMRVVDLGCGTGS